MEEQSIQAKETELETPDQSIDGMEGRTTESTPMPNTEEQEKKTIEFSPKGNGEEATNTPETLKDDSQTKRTSFKERIAAMVGMKPRAKEEITALTEKSKTFGKISTITLETRNDKEEATQEATSSQDKRADGSKTTSVELGDLKTKLNKKDKKLKCSEEDRQELKKEIRHNKNENLESYYVLAKATEEKLQQMSDEVETTDKERGKYIKKDMDEMKKRYDTVNEKLLNLETRVDTMRKDHAESSCAIQYKLDALKRNSIAQDNLVADKPQGPRVDFVEPQRKKRESTPLPRISTSIGAVGSKTTMISGTSSSTNAPVDSSTHTGVTPDAMTKASTWEMMNRTLKAFATRNTDSSDRGCGKSRKTFKKSKEFKDDSDGCIDTWVEVMRLDLEQDKLKDEMQACTAILSNLEGTKCVVAKNEEEHGTADKIF
ncbi:uncharacterized protein LOC134853671 [Symsagittifera roscoffensis]|uniref:uncharacterized protein LOC134853671 n=1 Tax=Symsagittifera roscoffensis TaxID=84072 RepID=UPI00307B62F7